MQLIQNKKYILIIFGVACIILVSQAILFWNAIANGKQSPVLWPFLVLIVALLALGYLFSVFLKTTNTELIDAAVEKRVSEERNRMLKELEKKNETEVQQENENDLIETGAKELIPKGNYKNIESLVEKYMKNLSSRLEIVQGIAYIKESDKNEFVFSSGYALTNDQKPESFKAGETLPGQVAMNKTITFINDIPENYFSGVSGLGLGKPRLLILVPLLNENDVIAILEIATFKIIEGNTQKILELSQQNMSAKLAQTIKS